MSSEYQKDPAFYRDLTGGTRSLFYYCGIEEHRRYRAVLNPCFSKRQVLKNEPIIHAKVDKLLCKLRGRGRKGVSTDLKAELRFVAVDVFTSYAFGEERCFDMLDDDQVAIRFDRRLRNIGLLFFMSQLVPRLVRACHLAPLWLTAFIFPTVYAYRKEQKVKS